MEGDDDVCCEAARVSVLIVWTKAWNSPLGAVVLGICDIGIGTIECSAIDAAGVVAGAEDDESDVVGALIFPGNIAAERRVPIVPSRCTLVEVFEAAGVGRPWLATERTVSLETLP